MSGSPRCDGTDNVAPSDDDDCMTAGLRCGWRPFVQGHDLGRTSRSAPVRGGASSGGGGDETHFALWRGHDDPALAQGFQNRPRDLARCRAVVLDVYPWTHADAHGGLPEKNRLDDRSRVLQHARVGSQHFTDRGERAVDVRVVRDTDADIDLPEVAEVVQDLPDDLAIGNHDARAVRVGEGGAEQRDGLDLALLVDDRDVFSDAKRLGEDDRQAGHHVAQHSLGGQSDSGSRDPQSGDQGQQLHAQILQRHDQEQRERECPADARQQRSYRRLQLDPSQGSQQPAADPAADHHAHHEDQDGDQQLRPEPERQIQDGVLDLIERGDLRVHRRDAPWQGRGCTSARALLLWRRPPRHTRSLNMTVTISGTGLTIAEISAVSRGEKVRLSADAAVLARVTASREALRRKIEKGEQIYGVTTLFGGMADQYVGPELLVDVQRLALWQHKTTTGPRLAPADVR